MRYFDAHCHIQFDTYDEDRDALIAQMKEEGIHGLVVGVDYESSKKAVALAQKHEHLYASVGLHPNSAADWKYSDASLYLNLAEDGKVVAIGECGLDYFRPENPDAAKQKQREVFQRHIELAAKVNKPLMIHARPSKGTVDAYEEALTMLESARNEYPNLRGNFHFFVGNTEIARRAVVLDFTLSYTAVLTFARDYDEIVRSIPLTHILSETDSPFVAPASRRGQRNDPLSVPEIVKKIAEIRGEDGETVRSTLSANACRVFKL
ncbi:MAG: sec-independent protein translocase protein TatD DNase family protein [Parcubacteria group bacterium]|nr:sec-independent protein translocase protein TatD DNase family protein [Parcubacteria group bacterium]